MPRLRLNCSGLVQAVGFRYFVRQTGLALGVTGFVMNLDNGDVLIEVQGTPEQLENFAIKIQKGNRHSRVDALIQYPLPENLHETSFEITYDG